MPEKRTHLHTPGWISSSSSSRLVEGWKWVSPPPPPSQLYERGFLCRKVGRVEWSRGRRSKDLDRGWDSRDRTLIADVAAAQKMSDLSQEITRALQKMSDDCLYFFFLCSGKIWLVGGAGWSKNYGAGNERLLFFSLPEKKKKKMRWSHLLFISSPGFLAYFPGDFVYPFVRG